MKTEGLGKILEKHPFFSGLKEHDLQFIAGCASNHRFSTDDIIFREGEKASKFYVVREGKISLEIYLPDRGSLIVQTIGKGEVFGWSWLFPPYRWHFHARAVEPARLIALDGECVRNKCETNYEFGYELMKRISSIVGERLQATVLQLLDIYNVHV
jgi:CRP/FNR family transcriptional regulator, cyclic AMP receptor protein